MADNVRGGKHSAGKGGNGGGDDSDPKRKLNKDKFKPEINKLTDAKTTVISTGKSFAGENSTGVDFGHHADDTLVKAGRETRPRANTTPDMKRDMVAEKTASANDEKLKKQETDRTARIQHDLHQGCIGHPKASTNDGKLKEQEIDRTARTQQMMHKGSTGDPNVTTIEVKHNKQETAGVKQDLHKPSTGPHKPPKKEDKQREMSETTMGNQDFSEHNENFKKIAEDRLKEIHELNERITEFEEKIKQSQAKYDSDTSAISLEKDQLKQEKSRLESTVNDLERKVEDIKSKNEEHIKNVIEQYNAEHEQTRQRHKRKIEYLTEGHEKEIEDWKQKFKEMREERDDLKARFSKLAGERLTNQNADIADLSDPNRALKLSEKFGQLYDDEWTDAYEFLKQKKMPVKDAITLLLRMLKDCLDFCTHLRDAQMDSLKNILLHPSQDVPQVVTDPGKNIAGIRDKPRISSNDEGKVLDVRRRIGVSECVLYEVKQKFIQETKRWNKNGYDKKHIEGCMPYLEKCVEICWLMVIHCPPLYVKLDVNQGDPLDLNCFTNYITPSEKIYYLVWPPLFNEERNGGLLKKGVAEGLKDGNKK